MDFELTEEQRAFAQSARDFAQAELAPHAAHWDEEAIFPREAIAKAGELGFCGLYAPEAAGGLALPRLDATLVFEEMAAADPSTTAFITIHNMATWMLGTWATPAVRDHWGPLLCSGDKLASYCLTEPGAGSDAASLKTRAELVGHEYVLNGSKAFISGAGSTDVLILMARTGDAQSGAAGISAFVVPADAPGITYDNVRIPADHLLGREGEGFKIAMKGLDGGRINIATCSVGAAQGALAQAQQYMQDRKQFGKPIASFQALQFKLADMATELVAARQMVRLAASKLDAGARDASTYCAMAKRFATDAGFTVCNEALQMHGGYGYIREYPLERLLRDARVHQILEGTNEIMRVIIARRMLEGDAPESIR
jgi:alkylation response protein AidB-like acyl-CoA dehydrogenase